jgi:DNA-binding response OmpR family regulator
MPERGTRNRKPTPGVGFPKPTPGVGFRFLVRIRQNERVKLLLVEDDSRMRTLVRRGLAEHGHVVEAAATGPEAVQVALATSFDAIVLDVMLPGCDGVEVVRQLRARDNATPVLMLTARDAAADVVRALDAGADDYLTKPFAFAVLLARLRALGRRRPLSQGVKLQIADLTLDPTSRTVARGGTVIRLTRTEHNLLEALMHQPGRVVTRDQLVDRVWGDGREVESNTLDAFIMSLRHKIETGGRPRLIQTIRGVGYAVRAEPEP